MIPRAQVTAWAAIAPWPFEWQVEQDLLLSRLMIDIANHELLGAEVRMRGGTCLHKVVLANPFRYSEDLDYVRTTNGPAGPLVDAIREIAEAAGADITHRDFSGDMVHVALHMPSSTQKDPLVVKVEINIAETEPFMEVASHAHSVATTWWSGVGEVRTFAVEELSGTKLRALYQRSKGRDLFDLWLVLTRSDADEQKIVDSLNHYMGDEVFTYPQLRLNLAAKLEDPQFRSDLVDLIIDPPKDWSVEEATDVVMERLGSLLRNAPPIDQIRGGAWRHA
jgi:predicted nucleotidyltransferase component of viral defense system